LILCWLRPAPPLLHIAVENLNSVNTDEGAQAFRIFMSHSDSCGKKVSVAVIVCCQTLHPFWNIGLWTDRNVVKK